MKYYFLASDIAPKLDVNGDFGSLVHYAIVISLVGGAFIVFLYLWKKGKLDMDEQPKIDMMREHPEDKSDKGVHDDKQ